MITADELAEMECQTPIIDAVQEARDEWMRQRSGMITASNFQKLVGTGKKKDEEFTKVGYSYLHLVIAERFGSWHEAYATSMQWGTDHEPEAFEQYAKAIGREGLEVTHQKFFKFNDDIGGTPDGLIGEDGCLEVKCPFNPAVHINTLLTKQVPKEYEAQVTGHMLNTGRKWCDFVSFDPRMSGKNRMIAIRVQREEAAIRTLLDRLLLAAKYVNDTCELIKQEAV